MSLTQVLAVRMHACRRLQRTSVVGVHELDKHVLSQGWGSSGARLQCRGSIIQGPGFKVGV